MSAQIEVAPLLSAHTGEELAKAIQSEIDHLAATLQDLEAEAASLRDA